MMLWFTSIAPEQSGSDNILISWDVVSEGITSIDNKDIFFQYLDIESRCVCPDEDGDEVPDDCDYEYVNNLCDAELDNSCGGNPDNCVAFTAVEIVDMNIQDSAVIPGAAFDNPMQIVVVPIDTSCGGQGLEQ